MHDIKTELVFLHISLSGGLDYMHSKAHSVIKSPTTLDSQVLGIHIYRELVCSLQINSLREFFCVLVILILFNYSFIWQRDTLFVEFSHKYAIKCDSDLSTRFESLIKVLIFDATLLNIEINFIIASCKLR